MYSLPILSNFPDMKIFAGHTEMAGKECEHEHWNMMVPLRKSTYGLGKKVVKAPDLNSEVIRIF